MHGRASKSLFGGVSPSLWVSKEPNLRLGLTGGIGSGKSEVARVFALRGALVIDADALAREAVAAGSEGLHAVAALWPNVMGADGTLDRAALAQIVFNDNRARECLNATIHPYVRRRASEIEAGALPRQLIVHEVPLLFETEYDRLVDATLVVIAPQAQRISRVMQRDSVSEAHVRARIAAQIAPADARARATYVIENDAGLEQLLERANAMYDRVLRADRTELPPA